MQRQRERYKASSIPQEQIDMLEDIGFNWEMASPVRSKRAIIWDEMYQQFKDYKQKVGLLFCPMTNFGLGQFFIEFLRVSYQSFNRMGTTMIQR